MKRVPYHSNSGNACALACYTMVAQYLMPEQNITFEQLAKIARWRKGYVVWGFPVWKWLMDRGMHMTDYDSIDYKAWAKEGVEGLRNSVSPVEFSYYDQHTYSLETESGYVSLMYNHPNFTYVQQKPSWEDVTKEFSKPGICDLTLNLQALNHKEGFAAHRVVLLDITDTEVVFHDPNKDGSGAYRHEPLQHFRKVFESANGAELARYSLGSQS